MARPLRIEFAGALYHATSRGDGRQAIFLGDSDRNLLLGGLAEVVRDCNWAIHAHGLTDNHYHLLVETPEANLARGTRQLNAVYTQRFNHGHGRVRHVFQGRYQAILVQDAFASDLHAKVRPDIPLREIPAVRRRPPSPLSQFAQARQRDAAIHRAYASGGYSLKQSGDYFGLHDSRISRILQKQRMAKDKT